ncbi:MAG: hypothetical protein J5820_05105 [Rhodocyclaceae bacterium]|nr:hypothetical protein [Rhodocyclaceae bacterium]
MITAAMEAKLVQGALEYAERRAELTGLIAEELIADIDPVRRNVKHLIAAAQDAIDASLYAIRHGEDEQQQQQAHVEADIALLAVRAALREITRLMEAATRGVQDIEHRLLALKASETANT